MNDLAALLRKTMPNVGSYTAPIYWENAAKALEAAGVRMSEDAELREALDVEAERAYVVNYIEGRDAALRETLVARVGDMVGRQAALDVIDAAWRAALAPTGGDR